MFLTSNPNVKEDPTYLKICEAITHLDNMGLLARSAGYCLVTSEIIQKLLSQYKIKSFLIECKVLVFPTETKKIHPIGFDTPSDIKNQIDTHIILITDTPTPFLIDGSIGHRLPRQFKVVIDSADKDEFGFFNINHPDCKLTYEQKEQFKLPKLHQEFILDRIETHRKMSNDIQFLKKLNYIGIILSIFAFLNVMAKVFGLW